MRSSFRPSASAEHLHSAVQLAAQARCHLIAVYTDSPPAGLSAVLAGLRPVLVTLLTVRSGTQDRLLDLGASLPQSLISPAALDISRKRNLGLLIGHVCGWTRMLFLDDDIRKLNVAKLSSAAALLDDYPVVGLQVQKYPDASVVGHARRLTGRRQEPLESAVGSHDAEDVSAGLRSGFERANDVDRHVLLAAAASHREDQHAVARRDARPLEPAGEAGVPAFVICPGGEFRDVICRRVASKPHSLRKSFTAWLAWPAEPPLPGRKGVRRARERARAPGPCARWRRCQRVAGSRQTRR